MTQCPTLETSVRQRMMCSSWRTKITSSLTASPIWRTCTVDSKAVRWCRSQPARSTTPTTEGNKRSRTWRMQIRNPIMLNTWTSTATIQIRVSWMGVQLALEWASSQMLLCHIRPTVWRLIMPLRFLTFPKVLSNRTQVNLKMDLILIPIIQTFMRATQYPLWVTQFPLRAIQSIEYNITRIVKWILQATNNIIEISQMRSIITLMPKV